MDVHSSASQIRSIPTLLAFRRGLAQTDKIMMSKDEMVRRDALIKWIEEIGRMGENDRNLGGGGGGGLFSRLFGRG